MSLNLKIVQPEFEFYRRLVAILSSFNSLAIKMISMQCLKMSTFYFQLISNNISIFGAQLLPRCAHHPTHNTFLCARTYNFFSFSIFFTLLRLASRTTLSQKDDHFIFYQVIIYFNVWGTISAPMCPPSNPLHISLC